MCAGGKGTRSAGGGGACSRGSPGDVTGKVERVLAVVIGPAQDKGFPEAFEGERIDWVELEPRSMRGKEGKEVACGRFQAEADPAEGMILAEGRKPMEQRLRRSADGRTT